MRRHIRRLEPGEDHDRGPLLQPNRFLAIICAGLVNHSLPPSHYDAVPFDRDCCDRHLKKNGKHAKETGRAVFEGRGVIKGKVEQGCLR